MGSEKVVKRKSAIVSIFVDGVSLDRAASRLNRKIDLSKLLKSLSMGKIPEVARYYTIIPNTDDSRHHSYLDAIHKAGFQVIVKRLPPKTVSKQINIYPEMCADIVAYSMGHTNFSELSRYYPNREIITDDKAKKVDTAGQKKSITVVCPSYDLGYTISLVKEFGVDTISADFCKICRC